MPLTTEEALVLDSLEMPETASLALARAADAAESDLAITFFKADSDVDLTPLKLLANEFMGDISIDPYSNASPKLTGSLVRTLTCLYLASSCLISYSSVSPVG